MLYGWCRAAGLGFEEVEPTRIDDQFVSSSLIRNCLDEGRASAAARFLGRPHRIRGVVYHGEGRGTGLGFPTANLDGIDTLIPSDGVYAAYAIIEGLATVYPAACHIRPERHFWRDEAYGRSTHP